LRAQQKYTIQCDFEVLNPKTHQIIREGEDKLAQFILLTQNSFFGVRNSVIQFNVLKSALPQLADTKSSAAYQREIRKRIVLKVTSNKLLKLQFGDIQKSGKLTAQFEGTDEFRNMCVTLFFRVEPKDSAILLEVYKLLKKTREE